MPTARNVAAALAWRYPIVTPVAPNIKSPRMPGNATATSAVRDAATTTAPTLCLRYDNTSDESRLGAPWGAVPDRQVLR